MIPTEIIPKIRNRKFAYKLKSAGSDGNESCFLVHYNASPKRIIYMSKYLILCNINFHNQYNPYKKTLLLASMNRIFYDAQRHGTLIKFVTF